MKVDLRDQIIPCWIEKYRPESHCDGRVTSAHLVSGLSMRRILVAGRYGALRFGSRITTKDSHWSRVDEWFSRSRPCDRLLHKSSENSPLSASNETPSVNSIPDSASGVGDQLPLVFIPPSVRDARVSGAGCFVSEQWERMLPISPFFAPPDPFRNEARRLGPSQEGGEQPLHHYFPVSSTFQTVRCRCLAFCPVKAPSPKS